MPITRLMDPPEERAFYRDEGLSAKDGYRQITYISGRTTQTTTRKINEDDLEGLIWLVTGGDFGSEPETRDEKDALFHYLQERYAS